jgi:peptidoglycan/xylan/chitin deacetylase (PgdA/CDA1 family)
VVYLGTDASGYANAYQWSIVQSGVAGKVGLTDSNQWVALMLSFSDAIVIGSPVRSTVQSVRLVANDNNTGPLTVYWGGLGSAQDPTNPWPNGVISLTFDDSGNKQFTVAAPKLSQYGYRGTLYPILDSTGLTQAQIRILHDRMGWEIGAHATTTAAHAAGLTGLSLAAADAEVRATRQYLLDNSYEADTFAYPLGNTNAAVQDIVRKYFLAARSTYGNSMETWPPSNLMNLHSYNVGAYTITQLKALADKVKANRDGATFMIHDIPDTKVGTNDISKADFESFVDYLATLGIPVMPYREVVRSFPASI